MARGVMMAAGLILLILVWVMMLGASEGLTITVQKVECVYENVEYEGDMVSGSFLATYHEIFWDSNHPGLDLLDCSSGACERNWSSYSLIHTKIRNRLKTTQLEKLVYCRANLRLLRKLKTLAGPMQVTAPAGNVVYNLKGTVGDKFEFRAPRRGQYKFCFHNGGPSPETITFNIHVGHIPTNHALAKDEHLNPVEVMIAQLREGLDAVSLEQNFLKARDTRHRRTVESTQRRLIGYTLAEYLALLIASASQIFLIRRMFNARVGYNRL